jgi:hypothetical protein
MKEEITYIYQLNDEFAIKKVGLIISLDHVSCRKERINKEKIVFNPFIFIGSPSHLPLSFFIEIIE